MLLFWCRPVIVWYINNFFHFFHLSLCLSLSISLALSLSSIYLFTYASITHIKKSFSMRVCCFHVCILFLCSCTHFCCCGGGCSCWLDGFEICGLGFHQNLNEFRPKLQEQAAKIITTPTFCIKPSTHFIFQILWTKSTDYLCVRVRARVLFLFLLLSPFDNEQSVIAFVKLNIQYIFGLAFRWYDFDWWCWLWFCCFLLLPYIIYMFSSIHS